MRNFLARAVAATRQFYQDYNNHTAADLNSWSPDWRMAVGAQTRTPDQQWSVQVRGGGLTKLLGITWHDRLYAWSGFPKESIIFNILVNHNYTVNTPYHPQHTETGLPSTKLDRPMHIIHAWKAEVPRQPIQQHHPGPPRRSPQVLCLCSNI